MHNYQRYGNPVQNWTLPLSIHLDKLVVTEAVCQEQTHLSTSTQKVLSILIYSFNNSFLNHSLNLHASNSQIHIPMHKYSFIPQASKALA